MALKDKLPVSYLLFTDRGRINRLTYWTASVFIWTSAILLTVIVPKNNKTEFTGAQTVFIQPLTSDLTKKRIAIAIPVTDLNNILDDFIRNHIIIEHVFDF